MPRGLVEKSDDAVCKLVWVLQVGDMVGSLDDENLRDAFAEKFVAPDDLISAIRAQPILVTVAESDRERKVLVSKAILGC